MPWSKVKIFLLVFNQEWPFLNAFTAFSTVWFHLCLKQFHYLVKNFLAFFLVNLFRLFLCANILQFPLKNLTRVFSPFNARILSSMVDGLFRFLLFSPFSDKFSAISFSDLWSLLYHFQEKTLVDSFEFRRKFSGFIQHREVLSTMLDLCDQTCFSQTNSCLKTFSTSFASSKFLKHWRVSKNFEASTNLYYYGCC